MIQNWKISYLMERENKARMGASRGITQAEYEAWCAANGSNPQDVLLATEPTIEAIYFAQYWQPFGTALPGGIDCEWFDMSVLHGPIVAAQILQQVLGLDPDGHMGLITLAATQKADRPTIIQQITETRLNAAHDPDWEKWIRHVETVALSLV